MDFTLEQLKEIAKRLNLQHHHNIGEVKLREQLEAHAVELGTTIEEVAKDMGFNIQETAQDASESTEMKNTDSTPSTVKTEFKSANIERLKKLTFSGVEADIAKKNTSARLKEANRLIRCTITCNNKNKTAYQGDIFAVRNAVLPEMKKFVPFGVVTHVPQMMLNAIREKQYQMFRKEKQVNGNVITKTYLVPEYNIQIHDSISKDELEAIRKKQMAEGFNGE